MPTAIHSTLSSAIPAEGIAAPPRALFLGSSPTVRPPGRTPSPLRSRRWCLRRPPTAGRPRSASMITIMDALGTSTPTSITVVALTTRRQPHRQCAATHAVRILTPDRGQPGTDNAVPPAPGATTRVRDVHSSSTAGPAAARGAWAPRGFWTARREVPEPNLAAGRPRDVVVTGRCGPSRGAAAQR